METSLASPASRQEDDQTGLHISLISAAKAVYREFKYTKKSKISKFSDFSDFLISLIFYGVPEVREVSRKLPGARGFVVIEYGPVASHGDPIQARNYRFYAFLDSEVVCLETRIS